MAAAVSFNPATVADLQATTCSVSGLTPSTAYTAVVTYAVGDTQSVPFTSDGGGNFSLVVTPNGGGTYTVTINTTPAPVVSGTFVAGDS